MPVAVNCCVAPFATEGLAGVTEIEARTAAVTVSVVEPVTPERVAEMVDVPTPTPVARPWLPAALETVAAGRLDDAQVTVVVMFWVELSE